MILQNRRPEQDAETADPTEKTADAAEKTGDAAEETGDAAETSAARANLDPDEGGPALASPPPPLVHVPAGEVGLGRCRGGTSPAAGSSHAFFLLNMALTKLSLRPNWMWGGGGARPLISMA